MHLKKLKTLITLTFLLVFFYFSSFAQVFTNEIHYDDSGGDANERIEIAGLAGTDLTGWKVVFYDGSGDTTYSTANLSGILANQCTVSGQNIGVTVINVVSATGLSFQNGSPDGWALVNASNVVVEFLSYEGTISAINGPAIGLTSTDIGVSEDGTGADTGSIQRSGVSTWVINSALNSNTFGACNTSQYFPASSITVNLSVSSNTGSEATAANNITVTATTSAPVTGAQTVTLAVTGSFVTGGDYSLTNTTITIPNGTSIGTVTFNVVNDALYESQENALLTISNPSSGIILGGTTTQTIVITDNEIKPNFEVFSNEIHYDNLNPEANERIEIAGTAGTSINGWFIYYYEGSNGQPYASPSPLTGTLPNTCTVGIQNIGIVFVNTISTNGGSELGSGPDGWAIVTENGGLVEFLTYEGSFVGTAGPALGVTSIDIGAFEDGNGANTGSIQRTGSTTWVTNATTNTFGSCNSTQHTPVPPCTMTASITNNTPVTCNGGSNGSLTVTASSGTLPYNYLWSNGATTSNITSLLADTYTVTVTDGSGCTASTSAVVTQPSAIIPSTIVTNVACNGGNNGAINLTVSGGTSPFTYDWSNDGPEMTDNDLEDLTGLIAGPYTVTVTDANSCTSSTSATVTQPAAINPSASVTSNYNGAQISCFGANDGQISSSPTGGMGPYTYLWSNGATTSNITSLLDGTYDVTVTDANGCTGTASVNITQPSAISPTTTVTNVSCFGGSNGSINLSVSGGIPTYTYDWSNDGSEMPDNDTEDLSGLVAGNYTVTVTDANGCSSTTSAMINEPLTPNYTFIGPGSDFNDSANWQGGCIPPMNDPNTIITINSGQTLNLSGNLTATIINNGTLTGSLNLNGNITNNGTVSPGN